MENIIWIQNYQSPCGELILGSLDGKLCLCDWMAVSYTHLTLPTNSRV